MSSSGCSSHQSPAGHREMTATVMAPFLGGKEDATMPRELLNLFDYEARACEIMPKTAWDYGLSRGL